jgi:hypothetical protein
MREETLSTTWRGEEADKDRVWYINPEVVEYVWPEAEELVRKALDTGYGELTTDDVYGFLLESRMQLFVYREAGKVRLAMVTETVQYPQYKACRIVAIGGSRLDAARPFWSDLCAIMHEYGVARIEALCHNRMARALVRKFGFEHRYQMVAFDVKGHCNA